MKIQQKIVKQALLYVVAFLLIFFLGACGTSSDNSNSSNSNTQKVSELTDIQAVIADNDALSFETIKNQNSAPDSILTNLNLISKGPNESSILWLSNNEAVISVSGVVNRPNYSENDRSVILTAIISKGDPNEAKIFSLTVVRLPQTDIEAVEAVNFNLTLDTIKGSNSAANNILADLTLPTSGSEGVLIKWSSDKPTTISHSGVVIRPPDVSTNVTVNLIATIKKGEASATRTFTLTVIKLTQTDHESVALAKSDLTSGKIVGSNSAENNILTDLLFPASGSNGTTISWNSNNPTVISNSGIVTRPNFIDGDATVTLTALVTKGGVSETKIFVVTVIKRTQTDTDAVAAAKVNLIFATIKGDNNAESNILTNLTLPTSGSDGAEISWSSNRASVISGIGVVNRPDFTDNDVTLTLTATISKGTASDTKLFVMTVIKLPQTDAAAVAAAKSNLTFATIKNSNNTENNILNNLNLLVSGTDGTAISWSSNDTTVISNAGTVTRPSLSEGDASVTLTAIISKGGASDTKIFNLTVIKLTQTDTDAVAAAKSNLTFATIKDFNSATNNILYNLILSTSGTDGTAIAWSSGNTSVISNAGTVTRPTFAEGDAIVSLTATISKGLASDTKVFNLTVSKLTQTDTEAVIAARSNLTFATIKDSNNTENNILFNLTLPTNGSDGTVITWSSNNTSVISNAGTVTRPALIDGDATVLLTATIAKGSASDSKFFILTVIKLVQTDADAVAVAKSSLTFATIKDSNSAENNILFNLTLSTSGTEGTSITWSSDNTPVIANGGTVTRPNFVQGDAIVTLTATISKGGASDTKVFSLTVIKQDQTDAEAVVAAKSDLIFDAIKGVNTAENNIKTDLTLPANGTNGTAISWSSNKPTRISNTGVVNRPSGMMSSNSVVTLTGTISRGSVSNDRFFTLTVIRQGGGWGP